MSYVVDLDAFYGPLDLLLYLIEKNQMNIYDIPIHIITDQYMEHLQSMGVIDLDQAGDFLVMASYLLNLKSQLLLPAESSLEEEEEELDPRDELVRQLLEYRRYKAVSALLAERMKDSDRVYFRSHESVVLDDREYAGTVQALVKAFTDLLVQKEVEFVSIPYGDVDVHDKMEEIIQRLQQAGSTIIFQDLFYEVLSKREALAMFLALLELIRMKKVKAIQWQDFGDIKISIKVDHQHAHEG